MFTHFEQISHSNYTFIILSIRTPKSEEYDSFLPGVSLIKLTMSQKYLQENVKNTKNQKYEKSTSFVLGLDGRCGLGVVSEKMNWIIAWQMVIFNYQIKINILIQNKDFSMSGNRRLFWQVRLAILMMLALIPHSQIIKTSFNKTKAINDELNAINNRRRSHSAPNLFYDSGLCPRASDHADLIANTLVVQHCIPFEFEYVGETIAYIQKPPNVGYFGGEATARWYQQETNYDYESGKSTNGENVDDFTTMVWRETTSVCIAIRETSQGSGRFYVVAHFFPVPNREGEYLNNVRKPI